LAVRHPEDDFSRSLTAEAKRRNLPALGGAVRRTLDDREFDICKRIAKRTSEVLGSPIADGSEASIKARRADPLMSLSGENSVKLLTENRPVWLLLIDKFDIELSRRSGSSMRRCLGRRAARFL
jgi:hypothetical protein